MQVNSPTVRNMAIYQACKPFFTGTAIAATLLLSVSCSHDMHADEQISKSGANAAQISSNASDADMAQGEMDMDGHNRGSMEHDPDEAQGVNTNHDVFHSRGLEVPAGTPVPALTVEVEEDPVRGWNLYVGTANFTFEPSKVNGESLPTEGHAHLYVNDKPIQRIYGTWTHLPELPPGTNKVRVTLNANGYETLTTQGKPIEDTVTVEVYDPQATTN